MPHTTLLEEMRMEICHGQLPADQRFPVSQLHFIYLSPPSHLALVSQVPADCHMLCTVHCALYHAPSIRRTRTIRASDITTGWCSLKGTPFSRSFPAPPPPPSAALSARRKRSSVSHPRPAAPAQRHRTRGSRRAPAAGSEGRRGARLHRQSATSMSLPRRTIPRRPKCIN